MKDYSNRELKKNLILEKQNQLQWEDPVAPLQSVLNFTEEMTQAEADWQIHCYGNAKHAFTFVGADIPELGIKYNEKAHRRSERSTDDFLKEILK